MAIIISSMPGWESVRYQGYIYPDLESCLLSTELYINDFKEIAKNRGDSGSGMEGGQGAYRGGRARAGQSIMVGEAGPEFFIPTTDAQIFSARRTEEMIMSALARGMNGGGEGGSPTIVTADNSVRSNSSTTNVINETITPLDTLTTSVVSSV